MTATIGRFLYLPGNGTEVLRRKYTITPEAIGSFPGSAPAPIQLWEQFGSSFAVPRVEGLVGVGGKIEDRTIRHRPIQFPDHRQISPNKEVQKNAMRSVRGRYDSGAYGALLAMNTGDGKTVVALDLIRHAGQRALILVHKEILMDQWVERIRQFLGFSKEEIGIVQGDRCEHDRPICVGMIQSVMRGKYDRGFEEAFAIVVFDECKKLGGEVFSNVAKMFPAGFRLGLAAEMFRRDGMDVVYRWHVGEELDFTTSDHERAVVIRIDYSAPWMRTSSFVMRNGELNLGKLITALSEDEVRTAKICHYIKKAAATGRDILILSDRVAHVEEIASRLEPYFPGEIGVLVGGAKSAKDRDEAKSKRIRSATFGMMADAVDIPEMDTLFLATPRADVLQSVGRILRRLPGKRRPVIADLVDNIPALKGFWHARNNRVYRARGYEVRHA